MSKRLKTKKPGTVRKIVTDPYTRTEKAEIQVHDADELYREIRIENTVQDENGHKAKLKQGAEVEVTIEADAQATVPQENGRGAD
jgi:hypothetical protein